MLAILDYKAGNQTSVSRALSHEGIANVVTADPRVVRRACGVIVPGVGAAGQAMGALREGGLDRCLRDCAAHGQPLLGICLGCQILLDYSEENDTPTLGIIHGRCHRFADGMHQEDGSRAPVPHMGWNSLRVVKPSSLLQGIHPQAEFYFVHSYYVKPEPSLVLATTCYGHDFCSVYGRDGLWAVQFHPEKSGRPGLQLLRNFATYCEVCHAQ